LAASDAVIRVIADITKAERSVAQLIGQLSRVQNTVINISGGPTVERTGRAVQGITARLSTLGREARTAVGQVTRLTEGVGVLAVSGKGLAATSSGLGLVATKASAAAAAVATAGESIRSGFGLGGLKSLLAASAAQLDNLSGSVANTASQLSGLSAPLQGIVDTLTAFGPGATAAAGAVAILGAAMEDVLGRRAQSLSQDATQALAGMTDQVQALLRALSELNREGGTLNQFRQLQSTGRDRLANNPVGTPEFRKGANTVAVAEGNIRQIQSDITDAIRLAEGLRSVSEETRALNTYNVTQRRNSFLKEQLDDVQALQRALQKMELGGAKNPFGIGPDQQQEALLSRYTSDVEQLQQVLGQMESRGANNPFGISAKQIEIADHNTKKWKADIEQVNAELADLVQLHRALGRMESQGSNPFGIEQDQIQEAYQYRFKEEKAFADLRGDTIRNALQMELDSIDEVFTARTKANAAALKDFDKRLARRGDARQSRDKRRSDMQGRVENTLVSGAFPLLFGAGPLATIGGFAGGALGSKNPMIGVFTSAIGQILDTYLKSLTDLGAALKKPTDALTAMEAVGLKVSESLRYTVTQLDASGRGYEAQGKVIAELNRQLGGGTVQSLFALSAEQKKLGETYGKLSAALAAEVLPAVTGAVVFLNELAQALLAVGKLKLPDWLSTALKLTNPLYYAGGGAAYDSLKKQGNTASKGAKPPALALEGQAAEIDRRVQAAEKERQLRQQGIELERSAVDLRLNAEDAVYGLRRKAADIERSSIELRQSIEDAIFSKRQELARKESDNLRQQAQLGIEKLDLSLSQIGKGDPTSKFAGSQLVDAAREYLRVRGEGEADLAQKERELKIKLADIDRDGTKFRLDVSKKQADLQLQASDYQRDVAKTYLQLTRAAEDYKVKVAQYQYAMAQKTYEEAKQTGQIQQIQAAATPLTSGGGGAPMRAGGYIDKEVLRQWLMSQGMGRTSGDFTNAGHRTPNHMLNAMDMGFTAPQYPCPHAWREGAPDTGTGCPDGRQDRSHHPDVAAVPAAWGQACSSDPGGGDRLDGCRDAHRTHGTGHPDAASGAQAGGHQWPEQPVQRFGRQVEGARDQLPRAGQALEGTGRPEGGRRACRSVQRDHAAGPRPHQRDRGGPEGRCRLPAGVRRAAQPGHPAGAGQPADQDHPDLRPVQGAARL